MLYFSIHGGEVNPACKHVLNPGLTCVTCTSGVHAPSCCLSSQSAEAVYLSAAHSLSFHWNAWESCWLQGTHTRTRTHTHARARTHTHTHARTHARTHAHTHTHTRLCTQNNRKTGRTKLMWRAGWILTPQTLVAVALPAAGRLLSIVCVRTEHQHVPAIQTRDNGRGWAALMNRSWSESSAHYSCLTALASNSL